MPSPISVENAVFDDRVQRRHVEYLIEPIIKGLQIGKGRSGSNLIGH